MKRNVSKLDRIVRILLGIICSYIALFPTPVFANDMLRIFIGAFGAINLFTGIFAYCPLYKMANISTYKE
jgi:hypothetical protein